MVKHKAFPLNIELAFELPDASGNWQTLRLSSSAKFQPALGTHPALRINVLHISQPLTLITVNTKEDEVAVNFINRWHLEKRDPTLKISPPVVAIRFYIEHTTPALPPPLGQAGNRVLE